MLYMFLLFAFVQELYFELDVQFQFHYMLDILLLMFQVLPQNRDKHYKYLVLLLIFLFKNFRKIYL